jgi:predicted amino acid dehydrogenase
MEKFAFIIHPLDVKRDAAKKYPPLRFASVGMVEGLMKRMSPKADEPHHRRALGNRRRGRRLAHRLPLSPRQFLELPTEFVYDKIAAAGRMGAEHGAKIVGLGAFTSVVGDAGISVAERLKGVINVTSGNSYTVYTAVEGLLHAAELMNVDIAQSRVAIIGATGSIGAVCAKMLAPQVAAIDLVGATRKSSKPYVSK